MQYISTSYTKGTKFKIFIQNPIVLRYMMIEFTDAPTLPDDLFCGKNNIKVSMNIFM